MIAWKRRSCKAKCARVSVLRQPRARTTDRWTAESWELRVQKREAEEDVESLIAEREQEYLDNSNTETALNLLKVNPWVPGTLTGPDQWISRSASVTYAMITEKQIRDFATFIFCKLNQPEFDHPRDLF